MSLGPDIKLSKLLGMQLSVQDVPTFVEYHPAYLLRNPQAKKEAAPRWKAIGELYQRINIDRV
jgi:uracil-DNA glycosylase